jgi:hypothetical protein
MTIDFGQKIKGNKEAFVKLSRPQYEILRKMDGGYKLHLVGHLMWRLSKGGKKAPVDSKSVEDLLRTEVLERVATSGADPMEFRLRGNLSDYSIGSSREKEPSPGKSSAR